MRRRHARSLASVLMQGGFIIGRKGCRVGAGGYRNAALRVACARGGSVVPFSAVTFNHTLPLAGWKSHPAGEVAAEAGIDELDAFRQQEMLGEGDVLGTGIGTFAAAGAAPVRVLR